MKKKIVSTTGAPAAIGPYSQAVCAGKLVFISGQLPIDMSTGDLVAGDIKKATKASMDNIKAIIEEAGGSMADIIKTTVLLADMASFTDMNEVYASYFEADYPARACYAVAGLPKGAEVEIEAIALLKKD